jgi:hypothetical protein
MAAVKKSVVKSVVKSAVKSGVKSAVRQPDRIASIDHLRDRLAVLDAADTGLERILQSRFSREQAKQKAAEQQKQLQRKFFRTFSRKGDERSTAQVMAAEIADNDSALAELLANKKPRGRAPKSYPSMESAYSSNVHGISYDAAKKQMFVTFKDGSVYQYVEVPENVYSNLLYTVKSGGSVGERFWDLIRVRGKGNALKTQYSYRKIQ